MIFMCALRPTRIKKGGFPSSSVGRGNGRRFESCLGSITKNMNEKKPCKHPTCEGQCRRIKKKKPKLIPLPKLLKKTEEVFNAYIRKRDEGLPCISCGKVKDKRNIQAGHYAPVKGNSNVRFNEWNVNGECDYCNGFDEFHLIGYRKNLINKIGLKAVEWIEENRNKPKKWTREELNEIIRKYS